MPSMRPAQQRRAEHSRSAPCESPPAAALDCLPQFVDPELEPLALVPQPAGSILLRGRLFRVSLAQNLEHPVEAGRRQPDQARIWCAQFEDEKNRAANGDRAREMR